VLVDSGTLIAPQRADKQRVLQMDEQQTFVQIWVSAIKPLEKTWCAKIVNLAVLEPGATKDVKNHTKT
jgi:hypothetical protein